MHVSIVLRAARKDATGNNEWPHKAIWTETRFE